MSNGCPNGRECRFSDAALFTYYDSVGYSLGKLAHAGWLSTTSVDNFRLSITAVGMQCAVPGVYCDYDNSGGLYANKVGAASGWSDGIHHGTCVDVPLPNNNYTYLCQMQGDYWSQDGDSGSMVWTPVTESTYTNIRIWGIHWGNGGTCQKYYSISHNVFAELNDGFTYY